VYLFNASVVKSFWLLAVGFWLLAVGFWLLALAFGLYPFDFFYHSTQSSQSFFIVIPSLSQPSQHLFRRIKWD